MPKNAENWVVWFHYGAFYLLIQLWALWVSSLQESFAQRCFALIDEYAPGFSSSIIGYDMLTPPDLEREIGLTGKIIFCRNVGLVILYVF